jgi:hypothetical protein
MSQMGQKRRFDHRQSLPVYPDQQTLFVFAGLSQRCHIRNHAAQHFDAWVEQQRGLRKVLNFLK